MSRCSGHFPLTGIRHCPGTVGCSRGFDRRPRKNGENLSGTEHLTFERRGATAVVTMNRPEARNALSLPMLVGMADAWVEIDADDEIRCAILTGAGGTFCSGMDLKSMSGPEAETYKHRQEADPDLHWKAFSGTTRSRSH